MQNSSLANKKPLIILYALIVNLILWVLLTETFFYQTFIAGVLVSILTALIFSGYGLFPGSKLLQPTRYLWFLVYIPIFTWACIKANLDVMFRVLHPELPINPGIVKIKTGLKTDIARTFLANSITLTPGTMSVEIVDDTLYIHWIDVKSDEEDRASKIIAHPFEKYLKHIFE